MFVSYAGVTQVAAIAEEVRHPGRNLPAGMTISLFTNPRGWLVNHLDSNLAL